MEKNGEEALLLKAVVDFMDVPSTTEDVVQSISVDRYQLQAILAAGFQLRTPGDGLDWKQVFKDVGPFAKLTVAAAHRGGPRQLLGAGTKRIAAVRLPELRLCPWG